MRIPTHAIELTDLRTKALLIGVIAGLTVSIALMGYSLLLYWASPRNDRQFVVAVPDSIDFGQVPQGVYSAGADLENHCDEMVRILYVRKSCDCSEVAVPSSEIAPGERVRVTCRWNTRGRRGHVRAAIAVVYSAGKDSTQRHVLLTLRAHVIPDFTFDPERLEFTEGRTETKRVVFFPWRLDGLRLYNASVSHPAFDATVDGKASVVNVIFRSERWLAERGPIDLTVRTNSQNEPLVSIPILVETSSPEQGR